jgi:hypothetical protein
LGRIYLETGAQGEHHVENISSLNASNFDRDLVREILATIKETLLLDEDALALLEFFLDGDDSPVSFDVKGVLAPRDSVDLDLHSEE